MSTNLTILSKAHRVTLGAALAAAMVGGLLVLAQPALAAASFAPAQNSPYAAGAGVRSVTGADFNGDGNADLAVANIDTDNVSVRLANGSGDFGAATNFAVGDGPRAVASADFNGDSKADLAVANIDTDNVSVLLGNGSGGFGAATNFVAGDVPISLTSADFNGDSKADLAVANSGGPLCPGSCGDVSVLLGNGSGGFGAATNFVAGDAPSDVTSADFNGDSKADLAVTNADTDNVSVLLGNGSGGFGAATNFGAGDVPTSVTSADFDGDTNADLAIASDAPDASGIVVVRFGDGAGGFASSITAATGGVDALPWAITDADFNGDGNADFAVTNSGSDNVSVRLGNGPVGGRLFTFGPATNFDVGDKPISITNADFDGDTKADLAVANADSDNVSVLLNTIEITNKRPVANNDSYSVEEGKTLSVSASDGVLKNDTDADGDPLTAFDVKGPSHGTLDDGVKPNGSFTYTPDANYSGPDSFRYMANDGSANSDAATVTINVTAVNPPAFSINDVSVTEGNGGTQNANFTVSLSEASSQALTVDYATAEGTATAGTDYQTTGGTLTFPAGVTSQTVSVPVIGDNVDESDETFFVNLSNPTNATISDDKGEGTITDDDPPPDTIAPTTTAALDPATPNGQNGWYTSTVHLTVSASDGSGSGVAETRCKLDPASQPTSFDDLPSSPCPYLGSGANVSAAGQHTLYAASRDTTGNKGTPVSKQFKIDATAPSVSCSVTPNKLGTSANNHKLVTVTASVSVTDSGGSGTDPTSTNRFTLVSVTSDQADSGLGKDDVPNDIQNWMTGTADTSGQLRAERYRTDRIYTLTYRGKDVAGNTKTCQATVRVPKG